MKLTTPGSQLLTCETHAKRLRSFGRKSKQRHEEKSFHCAYDSQASRSHPAAAEQTKSTCPSAVHGRQSEPQAGSKRPTEAHPRTNPSTARPVPQHQTTPSFMLTRRKHTASDKHPPRTQPATQRDSLRLNRSPVPPKRLLPHRQEQEGHSENAISTRNASGKHTHDTII